MSQQSPNFSFGPTNWAISNRTVVYLITVMICVFGIQSYNRLPKEQFPEVVIPTILVTTIYPGVSPQDIENLITRPLEQEIKGVSGVKRLSSNSVQDYSQITVEFSTSFDPKEAKEKVRDAVDRAKSKLPNDLDKDPTIQEVDISEIPIMNINLSGDFEITKLKKYAEEIEDRVEALSQITRVDIIGALDREIQVNVDMVKLQAAGLSLSDLHSALNYENLTVSSGNLEVGRMQRSMRLKGEFDNVSEISNIIIRSGKGAPIYLKDIASIDDGFKDRESYARLDGKPVITLNVIKRAGENLIEASDAIRDILQELQTNKFPDKLKITITGDMSTATRTSINDLVNSIIIGFILVVVLMMFFIGVNNSIFVAICIPLSSFLAFALLPGFGATLNMVVLFSFLLALGIVVDTAIVVVENIHRIYDNGAIDVIKASKYGAAEVFVPVLAGVLTHLAPFVPLLFWPGIVGKFMIYVPIVLILVLAASLAVAFFINPVFTATFMKPVKRNRTFMDVLKSAVPVILIGILAHVVGSAGLGNFALILAVLMFMTRYVFEPMIAFFQNRILPPFLNGYETLLSWAIRGFNPYFVILATFGLLIFAIIMISMRNIKVEFFPQGEPKFIYVYLTLPVGTDTEYTDSVTKVIESRVMKVLGPNNPLVESVISNVGVGAGDPRDTDRSIRSNKGKVSVAFVEYHLRGGKSTLPYIEQIRNACGNIPGAVIAVEQNKDGPPTGKEIQIDLLAEDFPMLIKESRRFLRHLDSLQIPGIEELKSDLDVSKPEILVKLNRERANREGVSTAQLGMELRTALYGREATKFRDAEDQYPIMVRFAAPYRQDVNTLRNLKINYRDMATGLFKSLPLSAVADVEYGTTYGVIKRKNMKRVVTLSSNVLTGYNANEINAKIQKVINQYQAPSGLTIKAGGQLEDQKETSDFLGLAFLISFMMILLILVTLFNSFGKTLILLTQIIFSVIGVLLGFAFAGDNISIVMTGLGIVALAGIVVNNGILLLEFTEILKSEYKTTTRKAVILGGKTRLKPVLLTAISTMLGLVPLAVGFNIDFGSLLKTFDPKISFGGDGVAFWGPLSWTIIYGLSFATFVTLVAIPALYVIYYGWKLKISRWRNRMRHKPR